MLTKIHSRPSVIIKVIGEMRKCTMIRGTKPLGGVSSKSVKRVPNALLALMAKRIFIRESREKRNTEEQNRTQCNATMTRTEARRHSGTCHTCCSFDYMFKNKPPFWRNYSAGSSAGKLRVQTHLQALFFCNDWTKTCQLL